MRTTPDKNSFNYRFVRATGKAIERLLRRRPSAPAKPRGRLFGTGLLAKRPVRATNLDQLELPKVFKSHLAWHAQTAARSAYTKAVAAGLPKPKAMAKRAAHFAVVAETARVQGMFVARHKAELGVIRARTMEKLAIGQRIRAERDHGPSSLAAIEARRNGAAVSRKVVETHTDLYLAQIAF